MGITLQLPVVLVQVAAGAVAEERCSTVTRVYPNLRR